MRSSLTLLNNEKRLMNFLESLDLPIGDFVNPYKMIKFTFIPLEEYLSLHSIYRVPFYAPSGVYNHRILWEWRTWYRRKEIKLLSKANLPFFYRLDINIYV